MITTPKYRGYCKRRNSSKSALLISLLKYEMYDSNSFKQNSNSKELQLGNNL